MKLPGTFPELDNVRIRMKAPLSPWSLASRPAPRPEPLEVELSSLDNVYGVGPTGRVSPLQVDGQQVLLYIKDTGLHRDVILHDPTHSKRYHIANCSTLETMRGQNRHSRYVATNRTSGTFSVDARDPETGEVEEISNAELWVCKNCLNELQLTAERAEWPEFSIEAFFRDHETFFAFSPRYTDVTAPRGGYPKNWSRISRAAREGVRWTCGSCGVYCGQSPAAEQLLHTHHIDGDKSNNEPGNLRVLCAECHNDQPGHGRHPIRPDARARLNGLRARQGKAGPQPSETDGNWRPA